MRRMRSTQVFLSAGFLGLVASLPGCASNQHTLYCGDEHRYVVEQSRCEGDGTDGAFIYWGYWGYTAKPGHQLDQSGLKGRVASTDATARTNAGLPARGGFGGNGAKFSSGG